MTEKQIDIDARRIGNEIVLGKHFYLSNKSMGKLQGVHPDLVQVALRAIEITPYDFGITDGVRDEARQRALVASGDSWSMDSKHLVQFDGWGHAFDFVVYDDGKPTWQVPYYRKVVQAFFTAAIEKRVQIEAGALWQSVVDGPHIQLNRNYYCPNGEYANRG